MRAFTSIDFKGDWDEFFELFMQGTVIFGAWWLHVRPWWEHRQDPNILFLKYEDMKADPAANVCKIAAFIGVDDLTEEQVAAVVSQSSFESMKENPIANMTWNQTKRKEGEAPFMRKGIVGLLLEMSDLRMLLLTLHMFPDDSTWGE